VVVDDSTLAVVDSVVDEASLVEVVATGAFEEVFDEEAEVDEDDDDEEEVEESLIEQLKSYRGVVVKEEPTIPKLGLGVTGAASWSVYHQILVFPKRGQPTSSQ